MSFSSIVSNHQKKLWALPEISTRLFANLIDMIVALMLLFPVFNLISSFIYSDDSFQAVLQQYNEVKDSMGQMSEAEQQEVSSMLLAQFYQSSIVSKLILNYFLQISFLIATYFVSWYFFKTTPGKYLLGLKIVDEKTLGQPSRYQFFIRAISVYLTVFTLGIGYVWLVFDKKKRSWHDKIAGTMVIDPKKYKAPV